MDDRLLILPDENRDGVADTVITFAKVHNPTGFEFWNGGVIVASVPNLIFLKDTDGDDVADVAAFTFGLIRTVSFLIDFFTVALLLTAVSTLLLPPPEAVLLLLLLR